MRGVCIGRDGVLCIVGCSGFWLHVVVKKVSLHDIWLTVFLHQSTSQRKPACQLLCHRNALRIQVKILQLWKKEMSWDYCVSWKNPQIPNHGYLAWWNYRKQLLWTTKTVLLRWVWICDVPKWVNCWEHSPDKNDFKDLEITGKRRNYWWLAEKSEMTTKSGKQIDIQFPSFKTQCWTFECFQLSVHTYLCVNLYVKWLNWCLCCSVVFSSLI